MAVVVHMDLVKDLRVEETLGVYTRVIRRVLVSGLTPGLANAAQFEALESAGLPTVNSPLSVGHVTLRLRSRSVQQATISGTMSYVDLEYVAYHDNENGVFSGGVQMSQMTTATDINGNPITVDYTFVDDPRYGAGSVAGPTQGAEAQVDVPSQCLRSSVILATNFPSAVAALWTGAINAYAFAGYAAGVWCCTGCEYEPHVVAVWPSVSRFRFQFSFQTRLGGWNPTVWYKDPDTGNPPPNLVAGVGIKTVNWYTILDYASTWPYFRDL